MLQGEHSAIYLTFNKLPVVINTLVSSIIEWLFSTGFTVCVCLFVCFAYLVITEHLKQEAGMLTSHPNEQIDHDKENVGNAGFTEDKGSRIHQWCS